LLDSNSNGINIYPNNCPDTDTRRWSTFKLFELKKFERGNNMVGERSAHNFDVINRNVDIA
jgi:hypothetical protein